MRALRPTRLESVGPYRLIRLVATGGMAQVYEAHRVGPHGFERRVAVKRVLPELAESPLVAEQFSAEARIQASLSHPNLVQVVDFGEDQRELYLVLEFVDGLHCGDLIESMRARGQGVELGPALHIAQCVLRGLEHVHDASTDDGTPLGLVHRDVSPHNILIGSQGQVKLADFGIAHSSMTREGTLLGKTHGKLGYVAPEQALGGSSDRRGDLFSVGVVLAEMLLGQPLFTGASEMSILSSVCAGDLSNLRTYGRNIPGVVHAVLEGALAVDPAERYQHAADFREDLELAVDELGLAFGRYELIEWLSELGMGRLQSGVQPVASRAHLMATPDADGEHSTRRAGRTPATSSSYRVRTEKGTVFGPLSMIGLVEMAATGGLGGGVQVARGEGPFLPPASIVGINGLWARPAYRLRESLAGMGAQQLSPRTVSVAGRTSVHEVRVESLAADLMALALSRRTGLLHADAEHRVTRIYFDEGRPVFSSSSESATLLGTRLIATGCVPPEAISSIVSRGWNRDRPLGEALVTEGYISATVLEQALLDQMEERLRLLASSREGRMIFVPGAESGMPPACGPSSGVSSSEASPSGAALVGRAILRGYTREEMGRLLVPLWNQPLRMAPSARTMLTELEVDVNTSELILEAGQGGSLAALVNRCSGDAEAIGERVRAVFFGVVTGVLRSG